MDSLVNYISRFNKAYQNSISPATEKQIAKLEELIGCPLPDVYKSFLETMGNNMGSFDPFSGGVDLSINTIIECYESGDCTFPKEYLLIGVSQDERPDKFLHLHSNSEQHPVVGFFYNEKLTKQSIYYEFDSLEQMFFTLAYTTIRKPKLKYSDTSINDPNKNSDVFNAYMKSKGFQKMPHSGKTSVGYDGGNILIHRYQPEPFGAYYTLAAESKEQLNSFRKNLSEYLKGGQ